MKNLFFLILFCSLSITVAAKQLSFNKQEQDDSYQFNYHWLDAKQEEKQLSFSLSKDLLFNRFRNFKRYQANIANQYINKSILKTWRKDPHNNSQLTLRKKQGRYELQLSSNNDKDLALAQKKLAELEQKARKSYLEKHFYHQFITYDGQLAIKPDHQRIAQLSVDDFKPIKPLILAEVDIKNIRYATNYVLSFSQAIPYSPLESRRTSSGAGFNPPAKLLWENQGDCDSKVTLTAAILRSLMPRVKIILVFIEGHALIGIEARQEGNDMTINYDNTTFVLGEPTGPASLALGKVSIDSEQAILNGLYTVEVVE